MLAPARLSIRPSVTRPWLGQGLRLTLQVTDAEGHGLPGIPLTCLAGWGVLSARDGAEPQRGASVAIASGPSGLATIELEPPLTPPLPAAERASLASALAGLGPAGLDAAKMPRLLAGLAAAYRAEAGDALRAAVDRLHAGFAAPAASNAAGLPVIPATIFAVAEPPPPAAPVLALVTLRVVNWLGPFATALQAAIEGDDRLPALLKEMGVDQEAAQLAKNLVGATRAVAGLERGVLGQSLRDLVAADSVNRYLGENAGRFKGQTMVELARAAGASGAAISGGGLAVYTAIESARDVRQVTGLGDARLDSRIEGLEGRLTLAEQGRVTRNDLAALEQRQAADLTRLRQEMGASFDQRIRTLETDRVTRAELVGLEQRQAVELTRLRQDFSGALEPRLRALETDRVTRAELAALGQRQAADIAGLRQEMGGGRLDQRLTLLEQDRVTRAELASLTERQNAGLAGLRQELSTTIDQRIRNNVIRPGPVIRPQGPR
ncbi:hypothetical protein [Roseomonas sp. 18066]|uniref:hypothetical protein n=1 Tax=Roseomonas sp. 18066 TaxID=2681412 RepID=UPI00135B6B71|nr:hypothetical protein [Roseomonas sp. 18066]